MHIENLTACDILLLEFFISPNNASDANISNFVCLSKNQNA